MTPVVLVQDLVFPECPRWHQGDLWFSDMLDGRVCRLDGDGHVHTVVEIPGRPSGIGWLPDGNMLVVSMERQQVLRVVEGGWVVHAELKGLVHSLANDMVVGSLGDAFVSNFGFDQARGEAWRSTTLVRVAADGRARVVADELMFPNGMVLCNEGRTLVVAETPGCCLTAFDVAADGSLSRRRVWATLPGLPDGICVDAEGCIWVALCIGGTFEAQEPSRFVRIREGGEVLASVACTDGFDAYACAMGGAHGRTLFMMEAKSAGPETIGKGNGRIRAVEVDVAGA